MHLQAQTPKIHITTHIWPFTIMDSFGNLVLFVSETLTWLIFFRAEQEPSLFFPFRGMNPTENSKQTGTQTCVRLSAVSWLCCPHWWMTESLICAFQRQRSTACVNKEKTTLARKRWGGDPFDVDAVYVCEEIKWGAQRSREALVGDGADAKSLAHTVCGRGQRMLA